MKEKKKTPITHGTRIMWVRYERIDPITGRKQTRLVTVWEWHDGTLRVYSGGMRTIDDSLAAETYTLYTQGFRKVAGGC